ncbi:MAG TPA: ATP-binding cassette domain-containing protein, partial [bacterium]|nr:ATP-binding cassette domain-containing protein [bacterium]
MNNLEFVGLQKLAYSEISELTFGQLRLAEIARCLMSDSELLLLDEPAAGLNPKETEDLARLLLEIKKIGKTIFIVEHDMNLVMTISEKIIVLNFGEFLAKGTPSEISTNPQVIASYLGDDQYIG